MALVVSVHWGLQGGGDHPDVAGEPLCVGRSGGHPGVPAAGDSGAALALQEGPGEAQEGVRALPKADASKGALHPLCTA